MDTERCYGCMRRKTQHPVCEHCGYDERTQNQANQLPIGTILHGQYEIGKVLGQGGFGITYMGWDTALDMPVAIKEFFPSGLVSRNTEMASTVNMTYGSRETVFQQSRERFLREAKILGMLRDIPGIVRVYNLFTENNTAYIIMEFIQGIDLRMYLKKHGRLSVEQTLRILKPVISSLGKLHETNLVHRDISPDNIMMRPDGEAKLLDFGAVSIVANADAEKDLNHSTMAIMKKGFAPVEQYQTRGSLGPWTDVYAMCATIYYCLTGTVPPDAHDRLVDGSSLNWREIPGLTERQIAALERGMAILPKDRIASMQELERELYGAAPQPAPKAAPKQPKPEKKPAPQKQAAPAPKAEKKPKKKKPIGLVIVALLLVCAIGAAALLWEPVISPRIDYSKAEKLMAAGEYMEAIGIFESLDGFEDSAKKIDECKSMLYDAAVALMNEGKYQEAADAFAELDGYQDSEQQIADCQAMLEELANRLLYNDAVTLANEGHYGQAAIALWNMGDYRNAKELSLKLWSIATPRETLSAGGYHTLGLKTNGTVVAAGDNFDAWCQWIPNGQCEVQDWSDIVAISAGGYHSIGLKKDGTVVATGLNTSGQCDVSGWTDIVAISAGEEFTVGLKADGTVVATGYNEDGQCNVTNWRDIVAIATGRGTTIGLKADGTVVAAGWAETNAFSGWKKITAITAGWGYEVGLKSDGTVKAYGFADDGRLDVDDWTGIVAVSGKAMHTVGLKSDGTVLAVGNNESAQCNVQSWKDIVAISAYVHTVGLKSNGTVVVSGYSDSRTQVHGWQNIKLPTKPEDVIPAGGFPLLEDKPIVGAENEDYAAAEALLYNGETAKAAIAFGKLGDYQDAQQRSLELWKQVPYRQTICVWENHLGEPVIHALREGGTVSIDSHVCERCGDGLTNAEVAADPTANYKDIVSIYPSLYGVIGLRSDGTLALPNPSDPYYQELAQWTDLVGLSVTYTTYNDEERSVYFGVKSDGTVVATGVNEWGQCDVAGWTDIVAVASSSQHTLGLKRDGTVVAVGRNYDKQCETAQWTDVIAILAGGSQSYGLKSNGTMATAGANYGDVKRQVSLWTNVKQLQHPPAMGSPIAIREDGKVLHAVSSYAEHKFPDAVAIVSARPHGYLMLNEDGTLYGGAIGSRASTWTDIQIPLMPEEPVGN